MRSRRLPHLESCSRLLRVKASLSLPIQVFLLAPMPRHRIRLLQGMASQPQELALQAALPTE